MSPKHPFKHSKHFPRKWNELTDSKEFPHKEIVIFKLMKKRMKYKILLWKKKGEIHFVFGKENVDNSRWETIFPKM